MSINSVLKKYWGYKSFRTIQKKIIEDILDKKDTLGIIATGGGKSICFQIPAIILDGVCLVITPLIALMEEQVNILNVKAKNDSDIDNDRVINYNKTREIINNIGDSGSSSNSSTRKYLDPRTSNMNGSRNLRNYINSGVLSNQGGKNSSTPSPSKRYYNDPYSNSSSSWGLSGRNGNSNLSRNTSSRSSSSSNWVNPSSSSRSSSSSSTGGRSYNYSSSSSGGVSTSSGRSSSSSSRSGGIRN